MFEDEAHNRSKEAGHASFGTLRPGVASPAQPTPAADLDRDLCVIGGGGGGGSTLVRFFARDKKEELLFFQVRVLARGPEVIIDRLPNTGTSKGTGLRANGTQVGIFTLTREMPHGEVMCQQTHLQ